MACFLVGTAEAVVVTAIAKGKEKSETKAVEASTAAEIQGEVRIPWSRKLMWLAYLLIGGAVLLAFEHVWHGEVVPWFPFLTAMSSPGDTAEMLHEMSTIGVTMCVIVTAAWGVMVATVDTYVKKINKSLHLA